MFWEKLSVAQLKNTAYDYSLFITKTPARKGNNELYFIRFFS
jgi:hypothetical protein